jgi:hypothetical protein
MVNEDWRNCLEDAENRNLIVKKVSNNQQVA